MKKFFALAAALLASVSMFAQSPAGSWYVMPKAGVTLASLTESDNLSLKRRVGFTVGPEFGYQLTDKFALSAGLYYAQEGSKFKLEEDVISSIDKATDKFDYINVPILANYYVLPGLAIKAGIQPGFLVSAKYEQETVNGVKSDGDVKDQVNSFDFAIPVGVSYEYKNFVLEARYNIGVTNVAKDSGKKDNDAKNNVIQFTLGYKIPF